ncbi:hypothetical protein ACXPWS_22855 [Mycobacterium sp. BMJ-28]
MTYHVTEFSLPATETVGLLDAISSRWATWTILTRQNSETSVTDIEFIDTCRGDFADYKIPKAFIRAPMIIRSPAGKADYRWSAALATART